MLALISVGLTAVGGFNLLNYYSSLALAIAGGILCGFAGVHVARAALDDGRNPFIEAAKFAAWCALVPAMILLLNMVRVRNCAPVEGTVFYLFTAALSMLFASQVGAGLGALVRRRWLALVLMGCTWLAWGAWDIHHVLTQPAIFVFNPFAGFISGAVYDDAIALDERLVLYRVANFALLAALWALYAAAFDPGTRRLSLRYALSSRGRVVGAGLLAVAVAVTLFALRGSIGYEVSRDDIVETLGGQIANERVTLIYDAKAITTTQAEALLDDHTYRLDQLAEYLGETYPDPVTSFVYGSVDQKRALMGAGRVYIAKPWLGEIHLNRLAYGHPVILHELAHVVLGRYSDSPLKVPTRLGVVPNAAVVEGAAEAFEWDTGPLTPHQWSAAMRRRDIAPTLASLLGPGGFYSQSSSKAYTVSGSFIRWFIDTCGVAAFKEVYRAGEIGQTCGSDLKGLSEAWGAFIDGLEVTERDEALAAARFSRKPIFSRTCPIKVARLEKRARADAASGKLSSAAEAYQQVARWVPTDPNKRLGELSIRAASADAVEATNLYDSYAALDGRNAPTDARALEYVGDALWRAGDPTGALVRYQEAGQLVQSETRERNVLVKAWVVAHEELRHPLGRYLLGHVGGSTNDYLEAVSRVHRHALVTYLRARRAALTGDHPSALPLLEETLEQLDELAGEMPLEQRPRWLPYVERESWRLLGLSAFWSDQLDHAEHAFNQYLTRTTDSGSRARYEDWLNRIAWLRAYR